MSDFLKNIREIHLIGSKTREFLVHPRQCSAFTHYGFMLAGISLATGQFYFARHDPNMIQILVSIEGRGQVLQGGRWRLCPPGMAYVTPAHQLHAYRGLSGGIWKVAWAIYSPEEMPNRPPLPPVHEPMLVGMDPRPWEKTLEGLVLESSQSGDPVLLEHWTALLHGYAVRAMQGTSPARLWRLWELVLAQLDYPWTLDGLARRAGLDRENLRRVCLRETGRSPMQQVTHLRMQHAVSLLAGRQKVSVVAGAVGYENVFAFSTAFKRHLGRSPRGFRAAS